MERKSNLILGLVGAAAGIVLTSLWTVERFDGPLTRLPARVTSSEHQLRSRAKILQQPLCPTVAPASDSTIVGVISLLVSARGRVLDAVPLEPDEGPIAEAMSRAALASEFEPWPPNDGRLELLEARLTFYFQNSLGQCKVIDPLAAPVAADGQG